MMVGACFYNAQYSLITLIISNGFSFNFAFSSFFYLIVTDKRNHFPANKICCFFLPFFLYFVVFLSFPFVYEIYFSIFRVLSRVRCSFRRTNVKYNMKGTAWNQILYYYSEFFASGFECHKHKHNQCLWTGI